MISGPMRLVTLMALLVTSIARGESPSLQLIQQIGIGWQTEVAGWMGFTSFSADGKMVASDGAASPNDTSGNLTFWTFPEGKFVRSLPFRPEALSSDWKYYATYREVGETATGKILDHQQVSDLGCESAAFGPDGQFLITPSTGGLIRWPYDRGGTLRVFRVKFH